MSTTINGIIYSVDVSNATVTGFTGDILAASQIESTVNIDGTDYSVRSIGNAAFQNCTSLTSMIIPDSVTLIGGNAFFGATSLVSATLPNNITSIATGTFRSCASLTSINIPNGVTSIGYQSFSDCSSLSLAIIPNSVTSIGISAFQSCAFTSITLPSNLTYISQNLLAFNSALASITIPNGVTYIDSAAFSFCSSLITVVIENHAIITFVDTNSFTNVSLNTSSIITFNNTANFSDLSPAWQTIATYYYTSVPQYPVIDGVIYSTIGLNALVYGFRGSVEPDLVIPDNITIGITTYPVVTIKSNAFQNCTSLHSITLSNSITSIETGAFRSCTSLTSITIPDSVTIINIDAFNNCTSLTSVTLPNTLTTLGGGAFGNCTALTSITLPNSLTTIGSYVFAYGTLASITIHNNVTTIYSNAFAYCNTLINVTIENHTTVTTIDTSCFTNVSSNPLSRITFYNTASFASLSPTWQTIAGYYANQIYNSGPLPVAPTITNFSIPTKKPTDPPFNIVDPSSNSTGAFTYTSSNTSVADISGNTITITGLGTSIITATQAATDYYTSGDISTNFISDICFPAGTPITTDQGIIAIEKINPKIHTINNKKIIGIPKTKITNDFLVCIEKHALGNNIPSQKTLITKDHRIFYNGKMRRSVELIGVSENIYKVKYNGETLYNVLMEKHDTMVVNNLVCETLNPENSVAKLYNKIQKCSPEEQERLINEYNEFMIKKINFSKKL